MSFLKFWGKKTKSKDAKEEYQKELNKNKDDANQEDKNKLRHSLSISRSGRFKSKNRERGKILDQPELFNGAQSNEQSSVQGHMQSQGQSQGQSHLGNGQSRSPNNTCRDLRHVSGMGLPASHNVHQTAVL